MPHCSNCTEIFQTTELVMSDSYLIRLESNTLRVSPNNEFDVPGDLLIRDARSQIQDLMASGQIKGGSLLKINGSSSLAIGYLLAHELGHLYQVIAVCDPRLHGEKQNRYVVVISYDDKYDVGDIIECSDTEATTIATVTPNLKEDSTFFANVEGDILKVGYIRTDGNQIAIDAAARIDELVASGHLKGGKLIRINGKATLLSCYVIANRLGHLYSAIAVYDPKICDVGIDRYIVALSHGSGMAIGSVLEYPVPQNSTAKVAICGYPGAGKTCLREGLKYAIKKIYSIPDDFCYIRSGCPDGDTAYFLETAQKYPEVARELRARMKKGYTEEYAISKADEISKIQNPLLIFDVGGKISKHNWTIMSEATHAIILAKQEEFTDETNVQPWLDFCRDLNLPVVAIVYSDYYGTSDKIDRSSAIFKGTVHHLDRRVDASSRPMVKELANLLISLPDKQIASSKL